MAVTTTKKEKLPKGYERPWNTRELEEKGLEHLLQDPVHSFRAETGIELIHKEPTLEELERIWKNWQLMTPEMKKESDKMSVKLFGMTNRSSYGFLKTQYPQERKLYESLINPESHNIDLLQSDMYFGAEVECYYKDTNEDKILEFIKEIC